MVTVGIDEAGRGCWAGPLVAGAVILGSPIEGLQDSKQLSKKLRTMLDRRIRNEALSFGLGWVTATEVDKIGLTASVKLAMKRALAEIHVDFDQIIIDGNINYLSHEPKTRAVIKADASIACVSAASILAKVARDEYMRKQAHALHPAYGFDRHVGYGTEMHISALQQYGITPIHRKTYKPIKAYLEATI